MLADPEPDEQRAAGRDGDLQSAGRSPTTSGSACEAAGRGGRATAPTTRASASAFPPTSSSAACTTASASIAPARSPVVRRPDEIYVKHMFNHAGVPCMYDDLVHLIGPSPTYTGTAMLQMARYGSVFASIAVRERRQGQRLQPRHHLRSGHEHRRGGGPQAAGAVHAHRHRLHRPGRQRGGLPHLLRDPHRPAARRLLRPDRFCKTMSLPAAQLEARDRVGDGCRRVDALQRADRAVRHRRHLRAGRAARTTSASMPRRRAAGVVALPWDNDFVFSSGHHLQHVAR